MSAAGSTKEADEHVKPRSLPVEDQRGGLSMEESTQASDDGRASSCSSMLASPSIRHLYPCNEDDEHVVYLRKYRAEEALLPDPIFREFKLVPEQVLSPPPKKRVRTDYSFGDGNGTVAYVNEYGELLLIRRYVGLGDTGMVVAVPHVDEWLLQERLDDIVDSRYLGIGFLYDGWMAKDNPQVQYINDRWPRISYDLYDQNVEVKVEIRMVIQDSCVIMQYTLETSDEDEVDLPFWLHLNIGLRPVSCWEDDYDTYVYESEPLVRGKGGLSVCVENEPKSAEKPHIGKLQLRVAVFLDGKAAPDNAPSYSYNVRLTPNQPREVTVIYSLRALGSSIGAAIPDELRYVDVCKFLQGDYRGPWEDRDSPSDSIFVFRRYLQHILSVCSTPIPQQAGRRRGVAFLDGDLLEPCVLAWGSTYQFRFLLMMYKLLDTWVASRKLKDYLQGRIKDTCMAHLEWLYEVAETTESHGWYIWYHPSGKPYGIDDDVGRSIGPGARHVLKLFEFWEIFPQEIKFVLDMASGPVQNWLASITKRRDPKSRLWIHKMAWHPIQWHVPQYREDEKVQLPHFRLSYLTVLWRALQSLQEFSEGRYPLNIRSISRRSSKEALIPDNEIVSGTMPPFLDAHYEEAVVSLPRSPTTSPPSIGNAPLIPGSGSAAHQGKPTASLVLENPGKPSRRKSTVVIDNPHKDDYGALYNMVKISIQNLAPAGIRSKILDCFTFNPVVQGASTTIDTTRKLLAVCRSARAEEPRSIFHSTDTTLYEALDWGFFDDESLETKLPVWTETVKAQPPPERDERVWDNPLQYALALLMAREVTEGPDKEQQMSNGPQPSSSRLRQTLLETTFSDGLFPDGLDMFKRPIRMLVPQNPRVRFEVPCILLLVDHPHLRLRPDQRLQPTNAQTPSSKDGSDPERNLEEIHKERRKVQKSRNRQSQPGPVDRTRLVEYMEPEWLYGDPKFFHNERLPGELVELGEPFGNKILQKGWATLDTDGEWINSCFLPEAAVIDVPRQPRVPQNKFGSDVRKPPIRRAFTTLGSLDDYLREPRTQELAKKRLITLKLATHEQGLALYARSPESERHSMLGFITRHARCENFALDRANKIANLWMSELHLGFFTIVNAKEAGGDLTDGKNLIKCSPIKRSQGVFTGSRPKAIVKAVLSFRMVGDMYDRYWTCWALSHIPGADAFRNRSPGDSSGWEEWMHRDGFETNTDGFHAQRRVLELRMFEKMAKQVHTSTEKIISELDGLLLKYDIAGFSGGTTHHDTFIVDSTALYDKIVILLRKLDENADAILAAAKDWNDRETDREKAGSSRDKPRWSESDEKKHGADLNAELRNSRNAVSRLEAQKSKIRGRIEQVTKLGDSLRTDLNLKVAVLQARSAEDVRLFTYATVLFLPLSFSSSLFSMAGAPVHDTVISFARAAVIALVITAFILLNVKLLDKGYKGLKKGAILAKHYVSRETQAEMKKSDDQFWRYKGEALADRANLQKAQFLQDPSTKQKPASKAWYFWFWIRHCFLIFPANRVALALEAASIAGGKSIKTPPYTRLFRIVVGLIISPLFVIVYLVLLIGLNLKDGPGYVTARVKKLKHQGKATRDGQAGFTSGAQRRGSSPHSLHSHTAEIDHRDLVNTLSHPGRLRALVLPPPRLPPTVPRWDDPARPRVLPEQPGVLHYSTPPRSAPSGSPGSSTRSADSTRPASTHSAHENGPQTPQQEMGLPPPPPPPHPEGRIRRLFAFPEVGRHRKRKGGEGQGTGERLV